MSNLETTDSESDSASSSKDALQEVWIAQTAVIYGLIANYTQEPLQETLDSFLHKLQNRGSEILGIRSGVSFHELTRRYQNESKENTRTGSDPPGA